jgi:hypothetical protein
METVARWVFLKTHSFFVGAFLVAGGVGSFVVVVELATVIGGNKDGNVGNVNEGSRVNGAAVVVLENCVVFNVVVDFGVVVLLDKGSFL